MAEPPARGALIGPGLYADIKRTIERVGGMPVHGAGITKIPTDLSGNDGGFVSPTFRIGTFTGAWPIGGSKSVTLVSNTDTTVLVTNVSVGVAPTGAARCCIAREGTAWSAISFDLTQQPGYSASGTQVLAIVNGNLRWIGTTACV